jgi:SAM-dependent methyltransferase
MSKTPFRIKNYDTYEDYIAHQCSKLDKKLSNPNGVQWLGRHERNYHHMLNILLTSMEKSDIFGNFSFNGKNCLCLGARGEAEVRAFIELGSFAIGVDLNPVPNNCYVVMGDAARSQYAKNSVDVVYTNALDHFYAYDNVFKQISKVLKPGGLFLLLSGSPEGARDDNYGSTYWTSQKDVEEYLSRNYDLKSIGRLDVSKETQGWFAYFTVFKNWGGVKNEK